MRVFLLALPLLMGCTVSLTNIHTEGLATDLVDETQTTDASPNVQLPLLPM